MIKKQQKLKKCIIIINTYGTQALREAISGSNYTLIINDLLILAGFGILFMLLSILLSEKVGDTNKID
ncbi:hypothetical protein PQ689_10490 [Thermoanaerobacterium thermosaccharolyticum]|uniref:hypothetical protein n=1 Tax=Thermoanaerobacterium thermosaccharolyticum TaxID=1517 RepID=UPI003DA7DF22